MTVEDGGGKGGGGALFYPGTQCLQTTAMRPWRDPRAAGIQRQEHRQDGVRRRCLGQAAWSGSGAKCSDAERERKGPR
jgi:hypothetical protein